ncbi:hypothetical protein L1987_02273 [Smallanthus sonchifolius]|uniref:Uncharacterized protein n=1 Tax=Smallanthus sonchifolius TaxID=185202 RepID=A0ACB9K7J0_9ASTR|nr:hypothetical protein L1987_02273 [Smallanthus sonchifolius]
MKNATGQTMFSLVFGTEAMIPTKMVIPTARINLLTLETNNEALAHDLDTVDELRDLANVRIAAYQQRIVRSYNKSIRIRRFQVGDLVLRKAFQNTTNPNDGKLAQKWEGPYLIDSEAGKWCLLVGYYGRGYPAKILECYQSQNLLYEVSQGIPTQDRDWPSLLS